MFMLAVGFFSYVWLSVAAAVWIYRDALSLDLRESRIARTALGWAFGALMFVPAFGLLYLATRGSRSPRTPATTTRPRADRYEWAATVIIIVPFIAVVLALSRVADLRRILGHGALLRSSKAAA